MSCNLSAAGALKTRSVVCWLSSEMSVCQQKNRMQSHQLHFLMTVKKKSLTFTLKHHQLRKKVKYLAGTSIEIHTTFEIQLQSNVRNEPNVLTADGFERNHPESIEATFDVSDHRCAKVPSGGEMM